MLSKEAIIDLQNDCSFEEIQRINNGISDINSWKIYSKQEARLMIDNFNI